LKRFAFLFFIALASSVSAYGPTGHEIVGGIADKVIANTQAAQKIYALTDGITLEKAAVIPDEIKSWDKNDAGNDPNAFPSFPGHPKINQAFHEFWRANPPNEDPNAPIPSHHWFHYTDVPVLNPHRYADGKTGRSQWDVVHMMRFCVQVLRGEVPENNERKITKPVAVILLAHYVGDIHQPLHVGAEYFGDNGRPVDPDRGQAGTEDEGGNSIILHLSRGTAEEMARHNLKLHGFWDYDTVRSNLPDLPPDLPKEERNAQIEKAKQNLIAQMAQTPPANWRVPSTVRLEDYGEYFANEILPIAREAHERLRFAGVHQTIDQGRAVMAGDAHEKSPGSNYADWSAKIVRDELHKAGWRLADLLTQALTSTSAVAPATIPTTPEPISSAPTAPESKPSSSPTPAGSAYGAYPTDYKQVVIAWMKTNALDASQIEWQSDPRPAELPGSNGQRLQGYLVIFNTPEHARPKTRSVLIRDGAVIGNLGF
jgi:hypothetical protein